MRPHLVLTSLLLLAACGDNLHGAGGPDGAPDGPDITAGKAIVVAGDFNATGVLSTVDAPGMHLTASAVAGVAGADPVVRRIDDKLYVINRFGGDNLTILDATTLALIDQIGTGAGSNPQDVAVVGDKLYVAVLGMGAVVVIDRAHDDAKTTIDLSSYDSFDQNPDCESIYAFGGRLYLTCGLLQQFSPVVNGKVLAIDPQTDHVVNTIDLPKMNPSGWIEPAPHAAGFLGDLLIPLTGTYTDKSTGCLAEISTESQGAAACAIEDTAMGGFINRVAGEWGVIGDYDDQFNPTKGALVHFANRAAGPVQSASGELLKDLAVCGEYLFASDKATGAEGVRVFHSADGATATEVTTTPLDVGLPPGFGDNIACMQVPL